MLSPGARSGKKHWLTRAPQKQIKACVTMTAGTPKASFKFGNSKDPNMAPTFAAAADMPWNVDLTSLGNAMTGRTKVATFGPVYSTTNSKQNVEKSKLLAFGLY